MRKIFKIHKKKLQYASPVLVLGALSFAVFGFGSSQAFVQDLQPFILVAENSIHLAQNTQISKGDIASNKSVHIAENNITSSNLFSDVIQIGNNSQINGNATYNRLIKSKTAEILGEETDSISPPVVELPAVSQFQTGNKNIILKPNKEKTINPGNYNKIELKQNSTLILIPGTYNISNLKLKQDSKLLYSDTTTLNIKTELRVGSNALIASNNPQVQDATTLSINYTGRAPVTVGDDSSITAKILSPDSRVQIADRVTFLGQTIADNINIGEGGMLSRKLHFVKESDPEKLIEGEDGARFIVNEIILILNDNATLNDVQEIADVVDANVTGFLPTLKMAKLEISATTLDELNQAIEELEALNSPFISKVIPNVVESLF